MMSPARHQIALHQHLREVYNTNGIGSTRKYTTSSGNIQALYLQQREVLEEVKIVKGHQCYEEKPHHHLYQVIMMQSQIEIEVIVIGIKGQVVEREVIVIKLSLEIEALLGWHKKYPQIFEMKRGV
ncbi:hypothetical protein EYC84_007805 [Monilinia fructicola]|uniref:Uncharacterized protein n=1 Tax=Monilinia fructicola TaxID=38448 RepID=A0A5M9JLY6_MONFR|nr:hypothetical protein EYC84_007805 [Monilinia fructicola]